MTENTAIIHWQPVSEPPPDCGWYLGMLLPGNSSKCSNEEILGWQRRFGTVVVWYNPTGSDECWWLPTPHRPQTIPIGHLITHWAEQITPPPVSVPARTEHASPWSPAREACCAACGGTGRSADKDDLDR